MRTQRGCARPELVWWDARLHQEAVHDMAAMGAISMRLLTAELGLQGVGASRILRTGPSVGWNL